MDVLGVNAKAFLLRLWMQIPFGSLCSFKYGNAYVSIRKNMQVIISSQGYQRMMPLNSVDRNMLMAIKREMRKAGYAVI
jgi:hypothetical protein